jgi:hypothetical protein
LHVGVLGPQRPALEPGDVDPPKLIRPPLTLVRRRIIRPMVLLPLILAALRWVRTL